MGLFGSSPEPETHLKQGIAELEKYEDKTENTVTVIVEESHLKDGRSKIYCPDCNKPRVMDLEATSDSCSCEVQVSFPD